MAGEERLDVVMNALMETAWLGPLDQNAKPARARVLAAFGLPPPKVLAHAPAVKGQRCMQRSEPRFEVKRIADLIPSELLDSYAAAAATAGS